MRKGRRFLGGTCFARTEMRPTLRGSLGANGHRRARTITSASKSQAKTWTPLLYFLRPFVPVGRPIFDHPEHD